MISHDDLERGGLWNGIAIFRHAFEDMEISFVELLTSIATIVKQTGMFKTEDAGAGEGQAGEPQDNLQTSTS